MSSPDFETILIDGAYANGGGQILRNSIALSCITGKGLHITKIRGKATPSGLKLQHLQSVRCVSAMCDAECQNLVVGASELTFQPKVLRHWNVVCDIKTAGSITLAFQALLPCMVLQKRTCQIVCTGGTNVNQSPQFEYLDSVLKPALAHFGVSFDTSLLHRGYYPKGGGKVIFTSYFCDAIRPIRLTESGVFQTIEVVVCSTVLYPHKVLKRAVDEVKRALKLKLSVYPDLSHQLTTRSIEASSTRDPCLWVDFWARSSTQVNMCVSSLLFETSSFKSEVEQSLESLLQCIRVKSCVDPNLQDQVFTF